MQKSSPMSHKLKYSYSLLFMDSLMAQICWAFMSFNRGFGGSGGGVVGADVVVVMVVEDS